MPNWCLTKILITHNNENELKVFDKLLDQWTSRDYMKNGFGHNWLGNIVLGSGIGTVDTNSETDFRCRGTIDYKDLYKDELTIETSTAWSPMLRMWVELVNKFIPNADITYTAEEPGCGIHYTNDPDLEGKYILDSWDDDIESDYEIEEITLIKMLQRIIGTNETNIDELIKISRDDDYEFSINRWTYEDIEDFI